MDLEEGKLEAVGALCANGQVREDKEASVLSAVLGVLEMIEG
jgi:hypothetical protein